MYSSKNRMLEEHILLQKIKARNAKGIELQRLIGTNALHCLYGEYLKRILLYGHCFCLFSLCKRSIDQLNFSSPRKMRSLQEKLRHVRGDSVQVWLEALLHNLCLSTVRPFPLNPGCVCLYESRQYPYIHISFPISEHLSQPIRPIYWSGARSTCSVLIWWILFVPPPCLYPLFPLKPIIFLLLLALFCLKWKRHVHSWKPSMHVCDQVLI